MPGLTAEPLDGSQGDPQDWPGPRPGFTASSAGWWCDRCGALVEKRKVNAHDEFHARLGF